MFETGVIIGAAPLIVTVLAPIIGYLVTIYYKYMDTFMHDIAQVLV